MIFQERCLKMVNSPLEFALILNKVDSRTLAFKAESADELESYFLHSWSG